MMTNDAFASFLSGLVGNVERKQKSRRKFESNEPSHIESIGDGVAELAVWTSTAKNGHRSVRFNLRRRDEEDRLLSTLRVESLPEIFVGLLGFCRKLISAEEWVDDKTRSRLKFIVDHLDGVESAALAANGEAPTRTPLFG